MGMLRQLSKTTCELLLPRQSFLTRGSAAGICLTFDDGPHPEYTPRVLDNLASGGLRGTFFVVGERAEQHPEIVRRIVNEGHEIGNHTWTHGEPAETSTATFMEELARTRSLIQDLTGEDCRIVRPPKGMLSLPKAWALLKSRQTIVLWNVDTKDYRMESWTEMEDWCRTYQPTRGDIVLMHDNRPHAATAAALIGTLSQFSSTECRTVSNGIKRGSLKQELASASIGGH